MGYFMCMYANDYDDNEKNDGISHEEIEILESVLTEEENDISGK